MNLPFARAARMLPDYARAFRDVLFNTRDRKKTGAAFLGLPLAQFEAEEEEEDPRSALP